MITETAVGTISFHINGAWDKPGGRAMHSVTNPATGATIAEVPYAEESDIDRAVRAAHEAFLKWRAVPVVERVQVLYRYKTLLEKNADELAAILTRENGKTAEDAKAEVRRGIQMVEVACGMPSLMMGDSLNDVARDIDSKTIRQPIGVCAGITPFNFPAMVPMWMYPFAIACGNTFVLKPSEKVPMTPTRAVELLSEAGLPAGVMNLVHGDKKSVDALLHHPLVKAVSFVGSTPVAKYIYATAASEGKRVQALGGAKNHLVVMADADMPKTVEAIIGSAFGAAGERVTDRQFVADYVKQVSETREWTQKQLEELGFKCWPSQGNFVLCRLGEHKAAILETMLECGVSLRDRPDCEGCVRISIGTQKEMEHVLYLLKEITSRITAVEHPELQAAPETESTPASESTTEPQATPGPEAAPEAEP